MLLLKGERTVNTSVDVEKVVRKRVFSGLFPICAARKDGLGRIG